MYIHTMNTNTVLRFLGWAGLTDMWLEANWVFFKAIANAIHQIKINRAMTKDIKNMKGDVKEMLVEIREMVAEESEDESEDESEVETNVTKTFSKS